MATEVQLGAINAIVSAAAEVGATIVRSHGSTIIVLPAREPTGDDLLTLAEAASLTKESIRTLKDARRSSALRMFGGQRSRTVRRADLIAWIETKRAPIVRGVDDEDMRRRMKAIEGARAARRTG